MSAPYNRHVCLANRAVRCRGIRGSLYRQVQRVTDTIAACRIVQGVVVRACGCNVLTAPYNRHVSLADRAIFCGFIRCSQHRQVQRVADTIAACRIEQGVVVRTCRCERLTAPYNRHVSLTNDAVYCRGIRSRLYRQVQRVADTIAVGSCVADCVVVRACGCNVFTAPHNRHISFADDAVFCGFIRCGLYCQVQGVADTIAS